MIAHNVDDALAKEANNLKSKACDQNRTFDVNPQGCLHVSDCQSQGVTRLSFHKRFNTFQNTVKEFRS